MVSPQEVQAASQTLAKIIDTFRAATELQSALAVVQEAVVQHANIGEEISKLKITKEELLAAIAEANHALAEAKVEKEKAEASVSAIKAQLKGLGL